MSDPLVDKVAEAICNLSDTELHDWSGISTSRADYYRAMAQAAIDAMGLTPKMPKCTCANPSGWNPLGHSHGCPMRKHLEEYGPPSGGRENSRE